MKRIGANGTGELFASKHTLSLLSKWSPKAPVEECYVGLETNGSLFDKEHWSQIENLGQYHLQVTITVMSFNEASYQYCSGVRFPIEKIEDNLRFIKSLREKGIINHLSIGSVVQEQNFRDMPDFTRRCIEEFGADYVRLRPYQPWGAETPDVAWFKDIRVKDHPLHEEYKRVMSDPIFKHPKCGENSGGLNSEWTTRSPYKNEIENEKIMALAVKSPELLISKIKDRFADKDIVIYGTEMMGTVITKVLSDNGVKISYVISYQSEDEKFLGVNCVKLSNLPVGEDGHRRNVGVIITQENAKRRIRYELSVRGYKDMETINDLVRDII